MVTGGLTLCLNVIAMQSNPERNLAMTRISLKQVPDAVQSKTVFQCNKSLFSEQIGKAYVVYSYGKHFPVALFKDGQWWLNTDRYSPTTSRHQSTVARGIYGAGQPDLAMNTAQLKELINTLH
jgi:hypothetical protein